MLCICSCALLFMFAGQFCLVYWPEEAAVSVVPEEDIVSEVLFGKSAKVKIGKKIYDGHVSAIGKLYS